MISILIKCLDISSHSLDINVIAAQCMLTLSEDNPLAISELKKHEEPLLSLLKLDKDEEKKDVSSIVLLKTLVGGILMNVVTSDDESSHVSCQVGVTLSNTLAIDHRKLLNEASSSVPLNSKTLSGDSEKKFNELRRYFSAQQQALEILANICSDDQQDSLADDDENYDSDPAEDENEFVDDAMSMDKFYTSTLPIELTEVFSSEKIVEKVWEKTILPAENVVQIIAENPETKIILKLVHLLRCRAFLCLNNLISSLDVEGLGGVENLYR